MSDANDLFELYCKEQGMSEDDIRSCSWKRAGMIDFAEFVIEKTMNQGVTINACAFDLTIPFPALNPINDAAPSP